MCLIVNIGFSISHNFIHFLLNLELLSPIMHVIPILTVNLIVFTKTLTKSISIDRSLFVLFFDYYFMIYYHCNSHDFFSMS